MVLHFPEHPKADDAAIRARRFDYDDTLIEPWHLPHIAAHLGCGGPCDQGRRACDCHRAQLDTQPLDPLDVEPQVDHRLRARIWIGYIAIVLCGVAAAGWWMQGAHP